MIKREFKTGTFYNADCFDAMEEIQSGSIDMILADLPYGTTACKWDIVLPLEKLWHCFWRVSKKNAPVVLTASQPFTSVLGMSQIENLKRALVWNKRKAGNIAQSGFMELKIHEDILIFHKEKPTYNPQKTKLDKPQTRHLGKASVNKQSRKEAGGMGGVIKYSENYEPDKKLPTTILEFSRDSKPIHPTQKPVALFEHLIRTYTNEGETVLDNTAGSGTTAIAAINSGRKWICIERDPEYFEKACARVEAAEALL